MRIILIYGFVVYECNLIKCVYIVGFKEGKTRESEELSQAYSHVHLLMLQVNYLG
jgi:hypothetical protein